MSDWRAPAGTDGRGRGRDARAGRGSTGRPPRPDVIATLDSEGLLPAITFVFSRAGCDAAVGQCLRSPLRLTTEEERAQIAEVIEHRCGDLADSDLAVLGYYEWREGLLRGLAAHHAGMLPAFRHTVEELFTAGLVKAVFATETLALGINMPARTVVLERLVKFNGEQHVPLTPGEYTQLTGRAGRRGIDVEGHAVVLWNPGEDTTEPSEVAGLASTRTFPLRSSFAPSYNMTINLVHRMGPEQAHQLLEQSFAQYQADRSVVGLVRGIERGKRMLDEIAAELGGPRGADPRVRPAAGADLRNGARAVPRVAAAATAGGQRCAGGAAPRRHHHDHPRPTRRAGRGAGTGPRQRRPAAVGAHRTPLGGPDFVGGLFGRVGAGRLDAIAQAGRTPPAPGSPRSGFGAAFGRRGLAGSGCRRGGGSRDEDGGFHDPELASLRAELRRHPVHNSPAREAQVRQAERYLRIERDNASWRRRWPPPPTRWPGPSTGSSGCSPSAASSRPRPATPRDRRWPAAGPDLQRERPVGRRMPAHRRLDGSEAAELAAVLSAVLYETRGGDGPGAAICRRGAHPAVAAGAAADVDGCRRRCAPTSRRTGIAPESRTRRRLRHRHLPLGQER